MTVRQKPIFDIGPRTEVDSMWFGGVPNGDLLALLLRQPDSGWELIYRFRWLRDDEDDRKSVYRAPMLPEVTLEYAREMVTGALENAREELRSPGDIETVTHYLIRATGMTAVNAIRVALGPHAITSFTWPP